MGALCLYDGEFRYLGYASVCRIRIFDPGEGKPYAVVATELESNPGTSVTNAAETIATDVWRYLERPVIRQVVWIEHYADRAFIGGSPQFREQFDLVTFDQVGSKFHSPRWRRISKQKAEVLCGTYL